MNAFSTKPKLQSGVCAKLLTAMKKATAEAKGWKGGRCRRRHRRGLHAALPSCYSAALPQIPHWPVAFSLRLVDALPIFSAPALASGVNVFPIFLSPLLVIGAVFFTVRLRPFLE